jgi:hypothetical protein
MGYFLAAGSRIHWTRFYQLLLAALAVNVAFFTAYHKFEILASLTICYVLFIALRSKLCLAFVAVYFIHFDFLAEWFDYPLTIVVSCVAQGMILRLHGWRVALVTGLFVTAGMFFVAPPPTYVLMYVLPSTLLITLGAHKPELQFQGLALLGRYPLTTYLVQYVLFFAIGRQV